MSANDFNVGSDTTINIIAGGQIVVAAILTGFDAKQITTKLNSKQMTGGKNRYRELEEGWEGTFSYDRADAQWDSFFAAKEAGRYAGQQPPVVSFTETTVNAADGSVSKFRYTGVTLKLDSIGERTGDKKVEQKISWTCSRRIQLQ